MSYVDREKLRELIEQSGMTIQDIATKADTDRPRISELVHGKNNNPRLSTLFAVARALGVWPGVLIVSSTEAEQAA